jgi:hypothetical protein
MKIHLEKFGGIIPGTDPVNLPGNGAQIAKNVDLSEGTIKPWSANLSLSTYNHSGGEISETEFSQGDKPAKPTATLSDLISNPISMFGDITAKCWKFARGDSGSDDTDTGTLTKNSVTQTSTGFILHCSLPEDLTFFLTMIKGQPYDLVGPLYQINIADVTATGQSYTFPTSLNSGASTIPAFAIPIYTDAGVTTPFQVGTLQCVDVSTPNVTGRHIYPGTSGTQSIYITGNVDFHFECNWIRNRPIQFYYLSMDKDANGHYGPESDVSDGVLIPPGKYATITYEGDRLYRSASTASGFGLINEGYSPFIENLLEAVYDELPPNGTVTWLTTEGSIKHPAGYALYYKNDTLYPSSEWVEFPRYWAVPAEYAYTFDSNIVCLALAGGTTLVFTENGVYTATGQHPGRLTVIKISDKPIGRRENLWKEGLIVGWLNEEGLVQYDGASGRLLTGEYMRADRWADLTNISTATCYTSDKTVCIDTTKKLRFDFRGDRTAAISTYTVTDGSSVAVWKSKEFVMPKPVSWYACRIESTGETYLNLIADGEEVVSDFIVPPGKEDILLPRTVKSWNWSLRVETDGEIKSITLATNRREL